MKFNIEDKYPLTIFDDSEILYSWQTIKVGFDLKRITLNEIQNYAIAFLKKHPNVINEYISEVIIGIKDYEMDSYLKNIILSLDDDIPEKNKQSWNLEWRKWRYCILNAMFHKINDKDKLLNSVAGLYADFGYPKDMEGFINYMPAKEPLITPQEGQQRLLKNVEEFLLNEKIKIDHNDGNLPPVYDLD